MRRRDERQYARTHTHARARIHTHTRTHTHTHTHTHTQRVVSGCVAIAAPLVAHLTVRVASASNSGGGDRGDATPRPRKTQRGSVDLFGSLMCAHDSFWVTACPTTSGAAEQCAARVGRRPVADAQAPQKQKQTKKHLRPAANVSGAVVALGMPVVLTCW